MSTVHPDTSGVNGSWRADSPQPTPGSAECLVITMDRREWQFSVENLHLSSKAELLTAASGATRIQISVGAILNCPPEARVTALRLCDSIARRRRDTRFSADPDGIRATLFDTFLSMLEGPDNPDRAGRSLDAALEAAAINLPNAIPFAATQIVNRLRELQVNGIQVAAINRRISELVHRFAGAQTEENVTHVRDILPDAPTAEDVVVPAGWAISSAGVCGADKADLVLIPCPIVITRRLTEIDGRNQSVELAWFRDGGWKTEVVSREITAKARTIVDLAAHGLPVTTSNADDLVEYLAEFETANLPVLPQSRVTHHMGWLGPNGEHGFLCGHNHIHGPSHADSTVNGQDAPAVSIMFSGADQGDEQLVDGFHAAGTLDGWRAAIKPARDYPRVQLSIIASLVPPLLPIVKSPNFAINYSGPTSKGKTTTQRVAASVWGCPDERSRSAAISTWDASRVYLERTMGVQTCMPLIVDDTKRSAAQRRRCSDRL